MSSLVSLHLDSVEYNADRIARLFPKCKPKNSAHLSGGAINGDCGSSNANQLTTIDINRNPVPVGDKLDDDCIQLMDNAVGNAVTHDRRSITDK